MTEVRARRPGPYFLLVVALSLPLWGLGALLGGELLPGLPLAALQFVVPGLAAAFLVFRNEGRAAFWSFLRRTLDAGRVRDGRWWLVVALLFPALWALSWLVMRASGRDLPPAGLSLGGLVGLTVAFVIAGTFEELGWMGYAYDPLERRQGALRAALALGAFWAAWHVVPLSTGGREAAWIAWWALGSVAIRVLHVWLFEESGRSLFAQAVFHASFNVSWQLFPGQGSAYDPAVLGPLLAIVALLVAARLGAGASRLARTAGD